MDPIYVKTRCCINSGRKLHCRKCHIFGLAKSTRRWSVALWRFAIFFRLNDRFLDGHTNRILSLNPFPCGIGPLGPCYLGFNTPQRGLMLKIWKKICISGKCLSFKFIFRCFIKKCHFIPVIHGFLGPTQKSWAIWPNAALWEILSQCGNNWLKEIRSRPVASLY